MSPDQIKGPAQLFPSEAEKPPRIRQYALVHILSPEFQGLNPADFSDIPEGQVEKSSPENLRPLLIEESPAFDERQNVTSISYRAASGDWVRLSVTPAEFGLFSRHIPMLAKTAINDVLTDRDKKLQKETGDRSARARGEDDYRAANRSAVRQVMKKQADMEKYLEEEIMSRVGLVDKFLEMVANPNLVRGTRETIKERLEYLRVFVFGDMLDAIGNQREWKPEVAERAAKILQKRLYVDASPVGRRQNFVAMLELAKEYYGHKRALLLSRIAESQKYMRDHPEAVRDVIETDAERERESAQKLF